MIENIKCCDFRGERDNWSTEWFQRCQRFRQVKSRAELYLKWRWRCDERHREENQYVYLADSKQTSILMKKSRKQDQGGKLESHWDGRGDGGLDKPGSHRVLTPPNGKEVPIILTALSPSCQDFSLKLRQWSPKKFLLSFSSASILVSTIQPISKLQIWKSYAFS